MSDLDIDLDLDAVLQSDMPTGLPVNNENLACRELMFHFRKGGQVI